MSKLLEILSDGESNSFKKLTALLQLETKALQHELNILQQQGIEFEITQDSVRLIPQLELLDFTFLAKSLKPYQVFIKPVIDSTNQYLLEHLTQLNKGDLCLAEYQTAGRGRRGRQWLSPFAGQAILSFYWSFEPKKSIEGLSLVIGVAIVEALQQAGADGVSVKWPNDILLNGRKLAGILVEIANIKNGLLNLIVGIGINLSLPKLTDHIDQPWAELCEVLPNLERNQLIIQIIKQIYHRLEQFEHNGINAEFRQKWQELDYFFGETVNIITEKQTISGIERGIDEYGYLQLESNDKEELLRFNGGEGSLRKKST